MTEQFKIKPRHRRRGPRARRIHAVFEAPRAGGAAALEFPISFEESRDRKRAIFSGSLSALIHFGLLGFLFLLASLAPVVDEELIPVTLLPNEPAPEEPAPAPRVLAERRSFDFAPSRAVAPQVVNPHVIASAAPAVTAEALDMTTLETSAAPTQIDRSSVAVETVSAVRSPIVARATPVDVRGAAGPVVRGPTDVVAPVGPSVGPRAVTTAEAGPPGTETLDIGSGSSVREGQVTNRDVRGSLTGQVAVSFDTAVGDGFMRGAGGTGTRLGAAGNACFKRPEVQTYMSSVHERMLERWKLPPGIPPDQSVTLKFRLDVAGSASQVELMRATDNALGSSAVDALKAASPFPPLPEQARCLSQVGLIGTFRNPGAV
jgi:hypothetical protein